MRRPLNGDGTSSIHATMQIGLVSCTTSKREAVAAPRDLYDTSAMFRKARSYCEDHHDTWYVLSARHGILDLDGPAIEPYDETSTTAKVAERREWAETVTEQLHDEDILTPGVELAVHAGKAYYEYLLPLVDSEVSSVSIPTDRPSGRRSPGTVITDSGCI